MDVREEGRLLFTRAGCLTTLGLVQYRDVISRSVSMLRCMGTVQVLYGGTYAMIGTVDGKTPIYP